MSKEETKKQVESLMKEFRNILADDDCTICVNDDDELAILKWHVQSKIDFLEEEKDYHYNYKGYLRWFERYKEKLNKQKEILKYLEDL
jgi:hypothetical protein